MSVPVLIVTGFLGAGKTTLINRLLSEAGGRKIAAIVNDFGAINIDADLIATRSEDVIGLENGCICCSLQGDLLRTLKSILSRSDAVDQIVIEASGVADPQGIVAAVLDPALHKAVRLSGVLAVVDVVDASTRQADRLWQVQVGAADFIALTKSSGLDSSALQNWLATQGKNLIFDADDAALPLSVIFDTEMDPREVDRDRVVADERFTRLEWRWSGSCPMSGFQDLVGRWSDRLLRAKGMLNFSERPETSFLFQFVGHRATLETLPRRQDETRLVLIGEKHLLDTEALRNDLTALYAAPLPGDS